MTINHSRPQLLADLLIHLARRAAAPVAASKLTAAQWSALRYFAHAAESSCTPSAFAEFHGTTRGTASQTVKSLVSEGLLSRAANPGDKRSVAFRITPSGQSLLTEDPAAKLMSAIASLPDSRQKQLQLDIQQLIVALGSAAAPEPEGLAFGSCEGCIHFRHPCTGSSAGTCSVSNNILRPGDEYRVCCQYEGQAKTQDRI
ncbi:MAG: MarR family transcriptional regulator [Marinobacter sp.]|nr:MarR family transcriptional regulator [Marinobacter sp.]